jgi:hypothetical protein
MLQIGYSGQVGTESGGFAAGSVYCVDYRPGLRLVSIQDRDLGAFCRIALGQGFANTLGSTGYDRNLPFESHRCYTVR